MQGTENHKQDKNPLFDVLPVVPQKYVWDWYKYLYGDLSADIYGDLYDVYWTQKMVAGGGMMQGWNKEVHGGVGVNGVDVVDIAAVVVVADGVGIAVDVDVVVGGGGIVAAVGDIVAAVGDIADDVVVVVVVVVVDNIAVAVVDDAVVDDVVAVVAVVVAVVAVVGMNIQ